MNRSGSRDERDQANEAPRLDRMFCPRAAVQGDIGQIMKRSKSSPDPVQIESQHFRVRDLLDRREISSFGKSRLGPLREELNEFGGPQYEALYRRWREQVIAFSVTVHILRASAREALRPIAWITTTSCSVSSAGRYWH